MILPNDDIDDEEEISMLDFLKEMPPPPQSAKSKHSSSSTSSTSGGTYGSTFGNDKAVIEFSSYESRTSDRDKEINMKAEKRRQSLQSLLEENQNVLSKVSSFGSKKSLFSNLSVSSSNSSLNKQETMSSVSAPAASTCSTTASSSTTTAPPAQSTNMSVQDQEKAYRASGAIPKKPSSTSGSSSGKNVASSITKPLPAIVEPPSSDTIIVKKKVVEKSKSLNIPSSTTNEIANQGSDQIGTPPAKKVIRQSSVPGKLELGKNISASSSAASPSNTLSSTSVTSGTSGSKTTSPCCAKKLEEIVIKTKHLSPSKHTTGPEVNKQLTGSGGGDQSDQSSTTEDTGAAMSAKNSKSPSPNNTANNICLSLEIVQDHSKKSPTITTTEVSTDTKKPKVVIETNTAYVTKPPLLVEKAASADETLSHIKQESIELPTILDDEVSENQSKSNVQVVTRPGLFTLYF